MSGEIGQELVERMVAFVRLVADSGCTHTSCHPAYIVAHGIAAELPTPVDPDLELAKAIAFEFGWGRVSDGADIVAVLLAAIKRARELERAK